MKIILETKELAAKKLTPDMWSILHLIYSNKKEFIPLIIDNSKYLDVIYKVLRSKGYLDAESKLTGKSKLLFLSLSESGIDSWIDDWRALWLGIKVPGNNYSVTAPTKAAKDRMKQYLKDKNHSNHTRDIIMEATKAYIEARRKVGYAYIKKAVKFIQDTEGSELESWCDRIINKENYKQTEWGKDL